MENLAGFPLLLSPDIFVSKWLPSRTNTIRPRLLQGSARQPQPSRQSPPLLAGSVHDAFPRINPTPYGSGQGGMVSWRHRWFTTPSTSTDIHRFCLAGFSWEAPLGTQIKLDVKGGLSGKKNSENDQENSWLKRFAQPPM